MSDATTTESWGANPFTYYGEKSNSELENAQNHFLQSWVPATLIATIAAAVATPLTILAGMKWGALASMGFIATPASGIALSILAAAIVTVITLVAVLAIQSCYRYQNSSEANTEKLPVETGLNGSSDTPISGDLENNGEVNKQIFPVDISSKRNGDRVSIVGGYLEKREDKWFWILNEPFYRVRVVEDKNEGRSIIINVVGNEKRGYELPCTIEESHVEIGSNGNPDNPNSAYLENSNEANTQIFPVDISSKRNGDEVPIVGGCLEKRENGWVWKLSEPSYRVTLVGGNNERRSIIINVIRKKVNCWVIRNGVNCWVNMDEVSCWSIPITIEELSERHE